MFLQNTIILIDRYYWKKKESGDPDISLQKTLEIRLRLRQLGYLYRQIESEEREAMLSLERQMGPRPEREVRITVITPLSEPGNPIYGCYEPPTTNFGGPDRLQLFAESFYYIAHRVVVLIRQSPSEFPELRGFEAPGIARVRNNLVEHAHKESGALIPRDHCTVKSRYERAE